MRQRELYFLEFLSGKILYEFGKNTWLSGFEASSVDEKEDQYLSNCLLTCTAVLFSGY